MDNPPTLLKRGGNLPPTPRFLPCGSLSDSLVQGLKQPTPLRPPQSLPTPPRPTKRPTRGSARALAAAGGSTKRGASGGDGGLEREMLLMAAPGAADHQKRRRGRPLSADLLQNCDLPPPAKLFGPLPTLQRLESAAGTDQKGDGGGNDSLLRALRLSQSRAREAEEKLAAAGASNGGLAALLVRDSVALSAHRRWVMMLEAENSVLRAGGGAAAAESGEDGDGAGVARHGVAAAWWVALAVCLGIAGVGLALSNLLL